MGEEESGNQLSFSARAREYRSRVIWNQQRVWKTAGWGATFLNQRGEFTLSRGDSKISLSYPK